MRSTTVRKATRRRVLTTNQVSRLEWVMDRLRSVLEPPSGVVSGDESAMPTLVRNYATIIARLSEEFGELPRHRVERCVSDVCACASHLGFEVTPGLVETIAREHLAGAMMSRPPPPAQSPPPVPSPQPAPPPLPRQRPASRSPT